VDFCEEKIYYTFHNTSQDNKDRV